MKFSPTPGSRIAVGSRGCLAEALGDNGEVLDSCRIHLAMSLKVILSSGSWRSAKRLAEEDVPLARRQDNAAAGEVRGEALRRNEARPRIERGNARIPVLAVGSNKFAGEAA